MTDQTKIPRIASLDILRGIAVMGILLMNILFFAMPAPAYFNPRAWGGDSTADLVTWVLEFVFVEDKFRGIFAMLFGAGVAILLSPHPDTGKRAWGYYTRRTLLLLGIGFAHGILLANNDILRLYAMAGLLVPLFLRLSQRWLWSLSALFGSVQLALLGSVSVLWLNYAASARLPGGDASQLVYPERIFGADWLTLKIEAVRYHSDYATILASRIDNPAALALGLLVFLPQTLMLMLAGVALYRNGFLTGAWETARYWRWALTCFLIATPPLAWLAWVASKSGFDAIFIGANSLAWSLPFDTVMAIGWMALLLALLKSAPALRIWNAIAAVGQLALSNYIGTSLVMTTIFYGYGLDYFGSISRAGTLWFVVAAWAAMLLWSPLWLRYFRIGPLEWLWRSLAKLRFAPLRR